MQYPSIIRAHNLCYTTIVLDPKFDNLPGVEYETVETGMGTFRFAQDARGVVPSLLEDLALFRKQAKRDMAAAEAAGDEWAASLHNGKQSAYKVTMNSVYGFLGATKGMLPIVPIAASVTAIGRGMIQKTKHLAETLVPGSEVVYGDSVAGYTPCIVRASGAPVITTFEALSAAYGGGVWTPMRGGKESCELPGVEIWSDSGWTQMERVIRHRAGKPMVRVVTHMGVVDVTEDHSLLRPDGAAISPRDLVVGDALLHSALPEFSEHGSGGMSVAEARVRGFFFGAGSAGGYTWELNSADMGLLESYKALCTESFPTHEWVITLESCYTLSPRGIGTIVALVREFRRSMYSGNSKVIPPEVLHGPKDVREAFWHGMCDGMCDAGGFEQKSQLSAATVFVLAESLGYTASVDTTRADKPDVYRITLTTRCQRKDRKDPTLIKKMHRIDFGVDDFVYDVTTANHHFAAGVGRLVVHNTDSVMVKFNLGEDKRHDMHAHFEVAARVAGEISATFKPPNELEFEKTYYPYLLFSKKRYAGE